MKRFLQLSTLVTLFVVTAILISLLAAALPSAATAQGQETATFTPRPRPPCYHPYPPPDTPTPTTEPTARGTSERPLVVVTSYDASTDKITPGIHFTLEIRLDNDGQLTATNLVATFASGDFFPSETGGVVAVNELEPGEKQKIVQPLIANTDLWGKYVASQPVTVSYTDPEGLSYSETFTITDELYKDIEADKLPNFIFVTPNMCNNAHDCSLYKADTWLRKFLNNILPAL